MLVYMVLQDGWQNAKSASMLAPYSQEHTIQHQVVLENEEFIADIRGNYKLKSERRIFEPHQLSGPIFLLSEVILWGQVILFNAQQKTTDTNLN